MITLGFLLLHALKDLQSQHDTYFFLVCLGFDELFWISVVRLVLWRRG